MTRSSIQASVGRRSLRPALAVLLALTLGACAGSAGASPDSSPVATTTVNLPKSYRFDPVAITVEAGATVTWTNNDNFSHNVKFDGADPLVMAPGATVTHQFAAAGQYAYVCTFHPKDMQGTVLVNGDETANLRKADR